MDKLRKLKDWHENLILNCTNHLDIDEYTLYWISFFKGMIAMALIIWII